MTKAKCIFKGKEAPPVIKARLGSVEAPLIEFYLVGLFGKYYDHQHKTEYSDVYVYTNEGGRRVCSHQLELQEDESYIIK